MLNYFLNEAKGLTQKKRKIIEKKFLARRKYNPFHLDCELTKKKLCYCKKNPMTYLSEAQKANLWTKSYMKPYEFYQSRKPTPSTFNSKAANGEIGKSDEYRMASKYRQQEQNPKEAKEQNEEQIEQEVKREFNICIAKVRALSKEELISFIQEHAKKHRRTVADPNDNHMMNMY